MLLHVNIQAGLLSKGSITVLTLVRFFTRVLPLVDLEAVVGGELLVAHRAHMLASTKVLLGMRQPMSPAVELLGAVLTLESLSFCVVAPLVGHHGVKPVILFAANVAHVGLRRSVGAVLLYDVFLHMAGEAERAPADITAASLVPLRHLAMHLQQVGVQVHGHLEHVPAGITQVALLVSEQVVHLRVQQLLALGAGVDALEGALRADADVACSGFPGHGAATQHAGKVAMDFSLHSTQQFC